jgi:hypothetical protein
VNPALLYAYYGGKRRRRRNQEEVRINDAKQEPEPEQLHEARKGTVIGAWLIPFARDYLKLGVMESYVMKSKIAWIVPNGTKNVSNWFGHDFLPIWALVQHEKLLSRCFGWFGEAAKAHLDILADEASKDHDIEEHAKALVDICFRNGWCFWVREGNGAFFGSQSHDKKPKWFPAFVEELAGQRSSTPNNVDLTVEANTIGTVTCIDENGGHSQVEWEAFLGAHQMVIKDVEDMITHHLPHTPDDFSHFDQTSLVKAMSPTSIANTWMTHYHDESSRNIIKRVVALYIRYCRKTPGVAKVNTTDYSKFMGLITESNKPEEVVGESVIKAIVQTLSEMTFRQLQQATLTNGRYKVGGMRRVGNMWIHDITTPDRAQNSRFIIKTIPRLSVDRTDGCPRLDYAFRSRPDRSTTGQTHAGYVKFIPKNRKFQPSARDLAKTSWRWAQGKNTLDMDVHVACHCPDFKYRWHYALSRRDATHFPTGGGNDATNRPPLKTNPHQRPCLCKHLYAMGDYVGRVNLTAALPQDKGLTPTAPGKPAKVRKNAKVE